jgi:hypothetical protein
MVRRTENVALPDVLCSYSYSGVSPVLVLLLDCCPEDICPPSSDVEEEYEYRCAEYEYRRAEYEYRRAKYAFRFAF